MMIVVRIKQYPDDHPNGYGRVVDRDKRKKLVYVSNTNMPFYGTFSRKVFKESEVEFVEGMGK